MPPLASLAPLATFAALAALAALVGASAPGCSRPRPRPSQATTRAAPRHEVLAYYFPNYHVDPRNEAAHGEGWTEWELVRAAKPRFPGHVQPKVPAWGHEDESDPQVMARKIDAAADHGITGFIFDWYWYEDGPFLRAALDRGFLRAPNHGRLRFSLMWANHDWVNIHPAAAHRPQPLLYPGAVSRKAFDAMADEIVSRYFRHPAHQLVDGRPYFSIYELFRFVKSMGGVEGARAALDGLEERARRAGLPGVHLNAVVWGVQILPGETSIADRGELLRALGIDSVTSYVWIHHVPLRQFPTTDYRAVMDEATAGWRELAGKFGLPYFPNVTMGWDASPRTRQSDPFSNLGYPFMAALSGNTPDAFGEALLRARSFVDDGARRGPKIVTINAWNEWTEGSYLEPDVENGTRHLEAVRRVFPPGADPGPAAPARGAAVDPR
jgi:hypothetical protein